jgi:ATP-dependent helicase HrpB
VRLYTTGDLAARPEHDKPEILREDLAEAFLGLHGTGVKSESELRWLDPPPAAARAAAEGLLARLGAVDASGRLTEAGKRMLAFPLSPRLARVLVEGERRGVAEEACLAAALLSERDIRTTARADLGGRFARGADASGPSDVLELIERYDEARAADFEPRRLSHMSIDARTAKSVDRAARQLGALARDTGARPGDPAALERALGMALLAGFPDRIARRRARGESALVLWSGKTARLSESSVVHEGELLVALDAEDSGRGVVVRLASAVQGDWLMELYPDLVEITDELLWNASSELVERVERIQTGSVVMDEVRRAAEPSPEAAQILLKAVRARGGIAEDDETRAVLSRLSALRTHVPEAGIPAATTEAVDAALALACEGCTRLSEVRRTDLAELVTASLTADQRRALAREAPESITLPGGRTVPVHYEPDKSPWVESRLQDFFGMTSTPTVLRGRVPLTVHLLAPNHRAVQVTTDLAGFWERHYPGIRRELCRRYPRHPWPEDGKTAAPPPPKRTGRS